MVTTPPFGHPSLTHPGALRHPSQEGIWRGIYWINEKQQNSKYKKQTNNKFQIQNFKQLSKRFLFSSFSFFGFWNLFVIY
jgi:hypothetical protein